MWACRTSGLTKVDMVQKISSAMNACSFKLFILSVLCVAFTVLTIVSVLVNPLASHPLSMPWRLASHSLLGGEGVQKQNGDTLDLERVLRQTAMPDKTVIVTTVNQAWATRNSMIDLFLESFSIGINTTKFLNHLLIVALDQKSYDRCISIHSHCFHLKTDGVDFSGEKLFMSPEYLKMMWRRIDFLRQVLEEGYSFFFSDADIMWFRDPFPFISPDADVQIACDHYRGHPKSLRNQANGGFLYARANKRTISFYKYWYMAKEVFPGKHDQDVLNKIKRDDTLVKFGLRLEFFDTKYISGFCESSHDFKNVLTMHANCCYGLQSKLDDLRRILADWRRFQSMTMSMRSFDKLRWSAPKACLSSERLVH